MMNHFEFNAPRFTNFNSDSDDEEIEKYFDFDHEYEYQYNAEIQNQDDNDKDENKNAKASEFKTPKKTPKKSECELLTQFGELKLTTPRKLHSMETRQDTLVNNPPLELRSRSVSRISILPKKIEEDATGKRKCSVHNNEPKKYMCMAEAVERFHKVTPARFHTRPRNETFGGKNKVVAAQKCTVPVSPHLKVLQRNRPINALSRKQLEDKEVEEMMRHQIKARPINNKIFKPQSLDFSQRSHQLTVFKPFNLTEFKKKIAVEPRPALVKFTARPVPKGLFKKGDIKNTSAPCLTSSSSAFPVRLRVPVVKKKEKENKTINKPVRQGPITTIPFSFYDRDMELLKKKEEKIRQLHELERKKCEFHANPLPKFREKPFQEKATIIPTIQQPFHLSADDRGKANKEKWEKKLEEEKMLMKKATEFKAKPPVILTKKPFVPVKTEHEFKTLDVHLNTEIRAKERALYDLKIQMKQKEIEEIIMQRHREKELLEEEEVARLRKELVHKANPVKHYKDVTVQPSNKVLTVPMSPKSFIEHKKLSESNST